MWSARMIHEVLTNEIYTGDLVQGRHRVKSYKVHQIEVVPEEDWVRVPNTHEAIIVREMFDQVLDRMGLSAKSGWRDKSGRVYIYYTLTEIQENLNCGHDKATKLLLELDTKNGCGLIERVKQGQGRPARIYVKRFTTGARSM